MHLFWERGFHANSSGDLVDALGIQRSSFYNAFQSREALFREAFALYTSRQYEAGLSNLPAGTPMVTVLVGLFREKCRFLATDAGVHGCLFVNSLAELSGSDHALGEVMTEALRQRVALAARVIRGMVSEGSLRAPPDTGACAQSLVAFLSGLTLLARVNRSERGLWEVCRAFLSNLGVDTAAIAAA